MKDDAPLYFVGAPIFEQTGLVQVLKHDYENWTEIQRLSGEQVTLYFFIVLFFLFYYIFAFNFTANLEYLSH